MQLDLQHLLRLARRWWWLLILAPLLGGLTATLASNQQPNLYSAEATLLVTAGVDGGSQSSVQAGQDLIDTYSMWITARPVLERTANVVGLPGGADALEGRVNANSVRGTLFFQVGVSDTNPDDAATIANELANQFIQYVQEQSVASNAQIKRTIDDRITSTEAEIAELSSSISALEDTGTQLTPEETRQLNDLRSSRANREDDLAQLKETSRSIDIQLTSSQTRIMLSSPAVAPAAPYAPATRRATMLGTVAGIALAIGAIAVLEYMDNTVRLREEVVQLTKSPILGTVGTAPDIEREGRQLFVLGDPRSSPAEAMRSLRANVEFASATGPVTSIAVSSPGSNEGKSTLTANLAVVMAQAGLETVIIDADLRRPGQHRIFGVSNERGLSTYLARPDQDWRTSAVHLNIPRLTLVPSGPEPPNPSDLLRLNRFDRMLAEIGATADVILIDTPPVLAVSDAFVVATKTDAVMLVCRPGVTRRDALRRAASTFTQGSMRFLGVVINRYTTRDIEYQRYRTTAQEGQPVGTRYFYGDFNGLAPARPAHPSRQNGTATPEEHPVASESA